MNLYLYDILKEFWSTQLKNFRFTKFLNCKSNHFAVISFSFLTIIWTRFPSKFFRLPQAAKLMKPSPHSPKFLVCSSFLSRIRYFWRILSFLMAKVAELMQPTSGFSFDLCRRNEMLVKKALKEPSYLKNGTKIVWLIFEVYSFLFFLSFILALLFCFCFLFFSFRNWIDWICSMLGFGSYLLFLILICLCISS